MKKCASLTLYGLADYMLGEIIEWYSTREGAEEAVALVVRDEPDFAGIVGVEQVEVRIGQN